MRKEWHSLKVEEAVGELRSDLSLGLTAQEVASRLAEYGPNRLAAAKKISVLEMFFNQFKDFMIMVLLAATMVSAFLGEYADAVTILVIVVVNAVLGCIQEFRAERSMEALRQMAAPEAEVIRGGMQQKIPAADLVPGDIVILEEGDRIPADLRLIQAVNLEIEEAALTGESVPVEKRDQFIPSADVELGDRFNMAYLGTTVTRGRGRGIVVATGMKTEMGNIAGMIQEVEDEQTPLQRRLAQLGKTLVVFCLAICALVVVIGVYHQKELFEMFMAGVSLAVAAIPEGLPAVVTVAMAIGVQRMARRNAIIRKLPAVETLGCATVICSDKTGTLTQNEMTVRKAYIGGQLVEISGEGYEPKGQLNFVGEVGEEKELFFKAAAFCNNAVLTRGGLPVHGVPWAGTEEEKQQGQGWGILGDPTEGALLVMAAKGGVWKDSEERVKEVPFDSDRKRMSVVYRLPSGGLTAYMKGASSSVLECCTQYYLDGRVVPLTDQAREEILAKNTELAGQALRVLALAYREMPDSGEELSEEQVEQSFTFLGLAGMIDPPRSTAAYSVRKCQQAGIRVAMITGDHKLTAAAVANELGLAADESQVLTGKELEQMDDEELRRRVDKVSVYARVSPRHKLRIVRALKHHGHVVAMTGDGVNDAPAIKEADIGVSMGITGTDVTKEASAMVLADDDFSTIVAAVEEGRGIYDNIRKFVRFLLSCNVGEVLTMFLAVLAGFPLPLVPIQILWMNLVTDGLPALALGVDPADKDIMQRKPRDPNESVFSNNLHLRMLGTGVIFALGTLFVFYAVYYLGWWAEGYMDRESLARTMAFNTLVFMQLLYVFTCRSEYHSVLNIGFFTNPWLVLAVLVSVSLQMAVVYLPFLQPIFKTVSLDAYHLGIVLCVAATPVIINTLFHHARQWMRSRAVLANVS